MYNAGNFDVAVIGAGHAGIEAALACARLGLSTLCFTINLDAVGNMPCNPAIGGTAKGHLVKEIDALGGEMGRAADASCIQYRLLNRGKGPAVHSLRAQADRSRYKDYMKNVLENQENLLLKQAEIVDIIVENGCVNGVVTSVGAIYYVKAAIVCSGTYLNSKVIIGDYERNSGPDGMFAATSLTDSLKKFNLNMMRFKTGTPVRVNSRSVDLSIMDEQKGENNLCLFSFENINKPINNIVSCYLTYTNAETHQIINNNLHRSPMYSGKIQGVGPRYCPSVEDKIVRFSDKPRHQIFLEPMGIDTNEMYVGGLSSSLPEDVQIKMIHSIKGMENAEIMRPAYAIEYDCIDPLELYQTMEVKKIGGLYGAGQFCGTSGYEEAAAQGIVAGINASLKILGKEPLIIDRADAYIGTLIDDLVTRGTREPYRIMTSRSEYRLILRQDNADIRLVPIGYKVGLNSKDRYDMVMHKYSLVENEINRIKSVNIAPSDELNNILIENNSPPIKSGYKLADLIKRPELCYEIFKDFDKDRPELSKDVVEQVEISLIYHGYIKRQMADIEQFKKLEHRLIPDGIDYNSIQSISLEARQKLTDLKPKSFGQASRISGVSPSDVAALMIYVETRKKN